VIRKDRAVSARVVILGSGIAGASAAFALARRGAAVTVVDSARAGQATAASAGIISPWSSNAEGPFYDLYAAGATFYPEVLALLDEIGVTRTDFRRTGALLVNTDEQALRAARERVEIRAKEAGPIVGDVRRLNSEEARALFPPLAPGWEGVFVSGGARVDGRTMRDALLTGAAHYGAATAIGRAWLRPRPHGVPRVWVEERTLDADVVIVASGAWVNDVLAPLGAELDIQPQRGQITHLRVDGADTGAWPSVHPLSSHYLVGFDDSRIAVGATRETGSGFDPRVTAEGQRRVLADALRVAPGLSEATFLETRVGLRPLPGGRPAIGPLPGIEGVHVLTGFGAGGLTMGPLAGDALARRVLEGHPPAEIAPFAPSTPA
jgi:D-amino-acid dehydrogenase